MSTVVKDLGAVSAYAYAVEKGYTGTEAEFAELMADYAEVGQRAEDAADSALESKTAAQTAATTATNKATEATTAATTATTKAGEASTSASTATSAKDTAVSAASTATTKATEATTAAATAVSAKDDAVSANTAAQSAKTAAQTAQTGAETAAASVSASAEQIATNAADISQLMSDLSAIESAVNNQTVLFDSKANKAIDITNQGNEINYNNFTASDYIPIGEHVLLIDTDTAITGSSALYDSNKVYIGGISFPTGHTLLTQTDGAYVRFSCQTSVFPSVKVSNLRLDKTLSVPDAYADSYSTGKIRGTLSDYQDNVILVKNLVESVTEGYYVANSTVGKKVSFAANSSYGYAKVYVEGGKDYAVNSANYSNSFTVVADAYDNIIGLLSAYATSVPTVYHMPSNAAYVVFCAQQLGSSGTKDIVVMRSSDAITDATISVYPYGVTKAVRIKNLTEDTVDKYLPKAPYINTVERQILDVNKWESGYIWMASGSNNVIKNSNPSYYAYPPIEVKAGSYNIVNLSGNFSFAVYKSDGTRHNLNTLWSEGGTYRHIGYTLTLPEDSILYLSNSNVSLSMIATGAFIMNAANTAPAYVYGEYNPTTKHVFYCGHGRPLNTLRAAIEEATKYFDSTVYVDNETFDLAQEFADVLPTLDGTNERAGLTLCNRVHVIFASGAKVTFNYSGNNAYVYSCFSPFNAGEYGFTLENAWVESTNCRYSVHDELNASVIPYHNIYKHCTFIHDSSASSWGAHQAIGGGLGRFGDILIEDCFVSSVGAHAANLPIISYHNAGVSAVAKSVINIRDTYVADGSIRVTNQGTNTVKSRAMISGCNVYGVAPYYGKTISADRADNMELFQWNNVVRTE